MNPVAAKLQVIRNEHLRSATTAQNYILYPQLEQIILTALCLVKEGRSNGKTKSCKRLSDINLPISGTPADIISLK